jgi:WD40 repeat protein/HEAT repeat protein
MRRILLLIIIPAVLSTYCLHAEEEITVLLKTLSSKDAKLRMDAMQKLMALGPRLKESKAALETAGQSADPLTKMLVARLLEISELDPLALAKDLGGPELTKRREAAQKLGMFGDAARDQAGALISALTDEDPQVRSLSAEALRRMRLDPKVAVPAIITVLKSAPKFGTAEALTTLANLGPDAKEAVPVLLPLRQGPLSQQVWATLARLGHEECGELITQLNAPDPKVRLAAVQTLSLFGVRAKASVVAVIALLKDSDRSVAYASIGTLGSIGAGSPDAKAALIELLKSKDAYYRSQAVQALASMTHFGLPAKDVIPALIAVLADESSDVTIFAVNALGRMVEAVPDLVTVAQQGDLKTRRLAVFALTFSAGKSAVALNALLEAMKDPDPGIRAQASRLMVYNASQLKPAVGPLATLVSDPDVEVRYTAVESLKNFRKDALDALPALIKALADPELKVRTSASLAINAIGAEAVPAVIPLQKEANPETRRFALSALHGLQTPEVLAAAVQALKDSDPKVRVTAVSVLMGFGVSSPEVLPALASSAKNDSDPEVRHVCEIGLRTIAPDSKATQDILQPATEEQWAPTVTLKGHHGEVSTLALSKDGKLVATGDGTGEVRLWDIETGRCLATRPGPTQPTGVPGIKSLCFSPDGRRLVLADYMGMGRVLEVPSFRQVIEGSFSNCEKIVFSPNGDRLVAFGDRNTLIMGVETLKTVVQLSHEHVKDLTFSLDGKQILLMHGRPRVYNVNTGEEAAKFEWKLNDFVSSGDYSSSGTRLLCRLHEKAQIVDLKSGEPILTFDGLKGLKLARFSRDGRHAVTICFDTGAKIWNAQTGALEHTLFIPGVDFTTIEFFPDNKRLATLSWDGAIRIWSMESGKCLATLTRPNAEQRGCLSITPDGERITASSKTKEVLIWVKQTK